MKRLTSIILCAAMLLSLFTFPVSAAEEKTAAVYGDNVVFAADFDMLNPTSVKFDSNAQIAASNDGNALKITGATDENGVTGFKGGAYYSAKTFAHNDAILKFDVLNESAGYHLQFDVWDETGTAKAFRINKGDITVGTWYTYVINLSNKTAYRTTLGAASWASTTLGSPNAASDSYANTLKIGSGSASSNSNGIWHIDNALLYTDKTAISAMLPADLTQTHSVYLVNEDFEGSTHLFNSNGAETNATGTLSTVDNSSSESDDTVLDIDLSTVTSFDSYWSTYYRSQSIAFPSAALRYSVSFDFRRLNDAFTSEAIGIQICPGSTTSNRVTFKLPIELFDKAEWYNISFETYETSAGGSALDKTTLKATKLSDGTTTTLTPSNGNTWSEKQCGRFELYPTVTAADQLKAEARKTAHYQFDDIKISYETSDPIKTELLTSATSGTVQPLLVGYDSNGIVTKVKEGTASAIETISTYGGTASAVYDVYADITDWQDAKSVKVLYWDGYENAKAYAPYTEIGDAIEGAVAEPTAEAAVLDITSDMLPQGATGNYTVFAYTTAFAATADGIPLYDASTDSVLVLDQFATAPQSVKYDKSLYDGSYQDIVVIVNADGASAAKKTLLEEVDPPKITNVVMQLGADESQRNFTWFSLSADDGKLTYAKADDLVDGAFPSDAAVIGATRDSADGEYSLKAYYYNNKATITGLEPDTLYYYQLSNGTDKTEMIPFTTASDGSSFSFAFGGDAQVGGSEYVDYAKETETWGRSVKQMVQDPAFSGIEFFVHGGDQVDSCDRTDGTALDAEWDIKDEQQYDIYTNHDEFLSLPQVITYGNHDLKTQGRHFQHFNSPNLDKTAILDGSAAGAATFKAADGTTYPQSADHYFTYKSALFIVLNTNTFASSKTYSTTVEANNKASAEEHAAYVKQITDMYKDDPEIMWTIVLYHHSPYGSSYHGNYKQTTDDEGTITFGRSEQQAYIDMRKYLMPALDECGVDMVLSGHDHVYTRTHIIKPETDSDGNYTKADDAVITPYTDENYTFEDGTSTPTFNNSWKDANGVTWANLQVTSKPVKVTNPDGILHVTGGTSSGSQVNGLEYTNRFTAVNQKAATRQLSRIDISPTSLTLKTYNLGTDNVENVSLVDEFTIERTDDVDVSGINLSESELTVAQGLTKTLSYALVPAEPTINQSVTWSSSAEGVATVENGVVTGVSKGTATITATTANGKSASCTVTVVDKVAVTGISIPSTLTMEALTTKTLTAQVTPSNASDLGVVWSSGNDEIATVNQNGSITAHKHGTVTITATANDGSDVSASCNVTVTYVASTATFPQSFTMQTNSEEYLNLTLTPENATYKNVTYASSNPGVVTVDQTGKLSAIKPGTSTVTATTPERTLSCTVTVTGGVLFEQNFENPADTTLYDNFYFTTETAWTRILDEDGNWILDMDQSALTKGLWVNGVSSRTQTVSDTVVMPPASGYTIDFDFRKLSQDGLQAILFRTFDQNSSFKGFKVIITAFDTDKWYDIRIVRGADDSLNLYYKEATQSTWTKDNTRLGAGYNGSSNLLFNYMDIMAYFASNKNETSAEDSKKTHWQMDNIRTYVDVDATDFAINGTSASLTVGDKYMLNPTFTPANATDNHVAYTSSNTSVATVDRFGNVSAVGAGNATITATSSATGTSKAFAVEVAALPTSVELTKTIDGSNWKFTVSSENIVGGSTVYVGAFNSNNMLLEIGSDGYSAQGNTIVLPQNSAASYFKAFIWGNNNTPCAPAKVLDN